MTVRGDRKNRKQLAPVDGLSGWQLVVALVVIAAVIITTLLITKSPEAVFGVTIPLLIALGMWAGRNSAGGLGE
jgi:hypothetical protein